MAPTEYAQKLRLELKQWEATFAAEHDGRKPSREDVKKAPEIAAKYKEYSKLRDQPLAAAPATSKPSRPKAPPQTFETPRKQKPRRGLSQNNSELGLDSSHDDPFNSSSIHRSTKSNDQGSVRSQRSQHPLDTPTHPNRIMIAPGTPLFEFESPLRIRKIRFGKDGETVGPTPQKTGKVLGLFESMMVESTPQRVRNSVWEPKETTSTISSESPSKSSNGLFETPRKRKFYQDDLESSPSARAASSATRSVIRSGAATIVSDGETPKKRRPEPDIFATPSFLRRSTSQLLNSSLLSSPPVALPNPMKPKLVKSLSCLMADLREMQDEILEEELDNLREIENAESENKKSSFPGSGKKVNLAGVKRDLFGAISSDVGEEAPVDPTPPQEAVAVAEGEVKPGEPTRVWKKKGLKRQTRRVKMRPVRNKSLPAITAPAEGGDSSGAPGDDATTETEPTAPPAEAELEEGSDEDGASNYSGSEAESDNETAAKTAKPIGREIKKKTATTSTSTKTAGKGKRAATTGANYCKLKIRTQGGMKGRGGGFKGRGGRFNRRR